MGLRVLVLAGGQSQRMGQDKALLMRPDGVTQLDFTLTLARALSDRMPLLSHPSAGVRNDVVPVEDEFFQKGPLGGIHAALHHLNNSEILLVLPADMPLLNTRTLQPLLSAGANAFFEHHPLPCVISVTDSTRHYLEQTLSAINSDLSLKSFLKACDAESIPVQEKEKLISTNTPEQWQTFCDQFSAVNQRETHMAKTFTDQFLPLNISVLTVSDSRNETTDTSGDLLKESLLSAGHNFVTKKIVVDNIYKIRATMCDWIADDKTQVIIVTGGTGFTERDSTPEAIAPLFDKTIEGFGELFRQLSYQTIGTSTVQSRALAGLSNDTLVFCIPGSTSACREAWDGIIRSQLDSTHKPCNFALRLKKVSE